MSNWEIRECEFMSCNCAYGHTCPFNALPTHGHWQGVGVFSIINAQSGDLRIHTINNLGITKR